VNQEKYLEKLDFHSWRLSEYAMCGQDNNILSLICPHIPTGTAFQIRPLTPFQRKGYIFISE
jgi:hypothetical protein